MSANDRQVAGDHYKSPIQCWDYIVANEIPYLEGQIIRYLTRWRKKNGIEDVYKAKHYLDKLIEVEEKNIPKDLSEERLKSLIYQPDHENHVFVSKLVMEPILKGYDYPLGTRSYTECAFCGALTDSMLAKQSCTKRPSSEGFKDDLARGDTAMLEALRIRGRVFTQPESRDNNNYYQITTSDCQIDMLIAQWYYKRMPQTGETTFVRTEQDIPSHKAPNYSSQRKEQQFDNHGYSYYPADQCEFGHHTWEPLPDYEAGNVCVHCGVRETK